MGEGDGSVDVVRLGSGGEWIHQAVPAGSGAAIAEAYRRGYRDSVNAAKRLLLVFALAFGALGAYGAGSPVIGLLFVFPLLVVGGGLGTLDRFGDVGEGPRLVAEKIDREDAARRYDLVEPTDRE